MSPAASTGARRPPQKGDQRRSALLQSLDHHLQEGSLDSINIADISRRAGVTRSAFYFYFENKAAAVLRAVAAAQTLRSVGTQAPQPAAGRS